MHAHCLRHHSEPSSADTRRPPHSASVRVRYDGRRTVAQEQEAVRMLHPHRVVVVGAGYAGLKAALTLADGRDSAAVPVELELVDQLPYHLVKVRLHQAATRQVDVTRPLH